VIPVWDYALMTEPLTAAQLASLGWKDRRGASDLFSHAWGGVIDTCTRFCPFFGTAFGGRLADPPDSGHVQAAPVPAGTRQVGGCLADPLVARQGRPQRGPSRRVAAAAGPARPRVRLVAGSRV
jgi:hypothetical protein